MTFVRKSFSSLIDFVRRPHTNAGRSTQVRCYALSRFPERNPGVARRRRMCRQEKLEDKSRASTIVENLASAASGADDRLKQLLLHSNTLVIERQLEMLNVFVGFEQSNKYTISSKDGASLGYIAEDPKGFLGTLSRQFLATHRPFRAVIMDNIGNPVLFLRRPFAWINSRMFVQRITTGAEHPNVEPIQETSGEVQQLWHLWRRRYDLFLKARVPQPGHRPDDEATYYQVAKVDEGFLAWHFRILDEGGNEIASIDRTFRGIGREIFTDTGRYSIQFGPQDLNSDLRQPQLPENQHSGHAREVGLEERALFLALAVNIDFDYFSRHSHVGGGGIFHFPSWD